MKILIVGGGIAGPALAGLLQRKGITPVIIDQAPAWKHIGFGLSLWGTGRRVLRELGVEHEFMGKEYLLPWERIRRPDGKTLIEVNFSYFEKSRPIMIHRADLHDELVALASKADVRLGTTIKELKQQEDFVDVVFSDGKSERFDLVVAADGIHSHLRYEQFGQESIPYGWRSHVFWLKDSEGFTEGINTVPGAGGFLMFGPTRERCFASAFFRIKTEDAVPHPIEPKVLAQQLQAFGAVGRQIATMLPDTAAEILNGSLMRVEMKPWHKGRIVCIGDAKHAVTSIGGIGANIALEDALVLSQEIVKGGTAENIPQILESFAVRRTPRVERIITELRKVENLLLARNHFDLALRRAAFALLPTTLFTRGLRDILNQEP